MGIRISNFVFLAVAALLVGGCSTYSKALKSGDRELMYKEALTLYDLKKYYKVITIADEILPRYYGSEREDSIAYMAAASNYKTGNFHTSSVLCDNFRRRFPRSIFVEDIEYMYAKGYYHMSPAPDRDPTNTLLAMSTIKEYMARYPNSIKRDELDADIVVLQNKLYDKSLINAKTYFNIGYYKSASTALRNALDEYPETPHREELLFLTTKSNYMLAHNSVASMQRDRYIDMMDSYYSFVSEFPTSKYTKELDKMMATAKSYMAKTGEDQTNLSAAK